MTPGEGMDRRGVPTGLNAGSENERSSGFDPIAGAIENGASDPEDIDEGRGRNEGTSPSRDDVMAPNRPANGATEPEDMPDIADPTVP